MSASELLANRLLRQSTWSSLSVQLLALAAVIPQAQVGLAVAAGVCGIIKLFVPEDSTKPVASSEVQNGNSG